MKSFVLIIAILFGVYAAKTHLKTALKFLCDNILGMLLEKLFAWIDPLYLRIKGLHDHTSERLKLHRLMGSLFLFCLTVLLAAANYYLIFYAMELIIPSSEQSVKAFGLGPAELISLAIMVVELLIGFMLLEVLGGTHLLELHERGSKRMRWVGILGLTLLLLMLISTEVGLALKRTYEASNAPMDAATAAELAKLTGGADSAAPGDSMTVKILQPTDAFEERMRSLPYWATAAISIAIPIMTAISAWSLQDMLLLILWTVEGALMLVLYIIKLVYEVLHRIVTNIDDVLEKILSIVTRPVDLLVSFIVFSLVKLKKASDSTPTAILLLALVPFMTLWPMTVSAAETHHVKVLVVLMDNTSSFQSYLHRALVNSSQYVNALEAGDSLIFMPIDKESLSNNESPVSITIPRSKTTIVTRQTREAAKLIKKAGIDRIMDLEKKPRATATDLNGAIVRAATLLNSGDFSGYRKYLLIYSDMDDNVGRKGLEGTTLSNVSVRFLYTELMERTQKFVEAWKTYVLQLGASKVEVMTPDQCSVASDMSWIN